MHTTMLLSFSHCINCTSMQELRNLLCTSHIQTGSSNSKAAAATVETASTLFLPSFTRAAQWASSSVARTYFTGRPLLQAALVHWQEHSTALQLLSSLQQQYKASSHGSSCADLC
jgi:hypothetical protein